MQFDRLKRREFMTLVGGAAAAWPTAAGAQQAFLRALEESKSPEARRSVRGRVIPTRAGGPQPFRGKGWPDASTTGPQAGTAFTNTSGELRSTANNQTIQNLNHNGYILVGHNNVTIQDCIINGPQGNVWEISATGGAVTGTKIFRCKIVGGFSQSAISTDQLNTTEIAFCDLSNTENGISVASSGMNIHDNYIHDLSRGTPEADAIAHFDGIQGYPGPYTNWTINHNTLITRDTSGIITAGSSGSPNVGLTVTNNLFMHNFPISYGMQVQFTDQLTITGNRISIDNPGIVATQRPIFPIDLVQCTNTTVSGNVNHETGAPITPSIS